MRPSSSAQRGVALITGLLLLLVVTLIAVAMFHGFGDQEQIAGNTREKQRALNAAVSAEQYAEWWLINGTVPPTAPTCNTLVTADIGQVCSNALTNYAAVPWTISGAQVGVSYTPFAQTQTLTGPEGSNGTPSQGSYYGYPVFYITYLGATSTGQLYQVDAYGYGGNVNTLAEVESTYLVTTQSGETPLDIQK